MTARPISSTASIAASLGVLPLPMCRTIFSISTIASSTRTPTTSASDNRLTVFIVKPRYFIPIKVGMTDKGNAVAATSVARQSRKNKNTTITARIPPSSNRMIDPLKLCSTGVTKLKASVIVRSGWFSLSCFNAFSTPLNTSTSPAPLLRVISNPITDLPFKNAPERRSAIVSLTLAT